jgi:hypothetical protein
MEGRFLLTGNSAERIRDTIRTVESMVARSDTTLLPTRFVEGAPQPLDNFRIGTFGSAAWSLNSSNTVTLTNVGVTGYTVLATNIFESVEAGASTQNCAIAKDGTSWYLIQPFLQYAREGSFNGAWPIDSYKSVRLSGDTSSTVSVKNTLINYPAPPFGRETCRCVIVKDKGTWVLANWQVATATAVFVGSTYTQQLISDIAIAAELNTSSCTITIKKTVTTTFITLLGGTYTATYVKLV